MSVHFSMLAPEASRSRESFCRRHQVKVMFEFQNLGKDAKNDVSHVTMKVRAVKGLPVAGLMRVPGWTGVLDSSELSLFHPIHPAVVIAIAYYFVHLSTVLRFDFAQYGRGSVTVKDDN